MRLLSGRGLEREKAENFVTDILKGCENMEARFRCSMKASKIIFVVVKAKE
jgi:hypothetical protein